MKSWYKRWKKGWDVARTLAIKVYYIRGIRVYRIQPSYLIFFPRTRKTKHTHSSSQFLGSHRRPSHHALFFSRLCGIVSLISVSRSLANSTLRALLRLLGRSFSIFVVLLRLGGPRSSAGNVDRGENVSRRFCFIEPGLASPAPTLLLDISADNGRGARFDFLVELVAGGRLT